MRCNMQLHPKGINYDSTVVLCNPVMLIQRYKMKGKAELKKLLGVFVVFKSKPKSVINLLGLGSNLKIIFFLDLWFESIC